MASSSEGGAPDAAQLRAGPAYDARVEPLLALSSRTVDVTLAFGEKASEEVRLVGRLAPAARLELESVDPAGPDVEVVPADAEKPQGLRLTMTGTRVGTVAGQVLIGTGLEKPKTLTLLYSSHVLGNLSVDPSNPFIDMRALGPVGVVVRVTSRRSDFRLEAVRMVEGPFEASFIREQDGYAVTVRPRMDRVPEEQRGLLGTLRLLSNDPAEPERDVPVFALGAVNQNVEE